MVERKQTDEERKAEIAQTRKDCEKIVKLVNPSNKTDVRWEWGRGWFWNFKEDYIVMDERDLQTKSREYCMGVALHESLHVWMSRTEHFTDQEWGQLGFAIGFNFAEDCGIENAADRVRYGGRKLIRGHLDVDVQKGGGLDITINQDINGRLGYIPKHMILGGVMRQYFYGRQVAGTLNENEQIPQYPEDIPPQENKAKVDEFMEMVKGIDPDVSAAFEKIRPLIEQFWSTIPDTWDNEEGIQKYAKDRADVYRKIWDIYKDLVEQSVQDQALKDFIEELIKGGQFNGQPGQGGQMVVIDISALPPEVRQEIQDLIEEMQQEQQQQQAGGQGQSGQQAGTQQSGSGESGDQQSGSGQPGEFGGEQETSESGSQAQSGGASGGQPSSEMGEQESQQGSTGQPSSTESQSGESSQGEASGDQTGSESGESDKAGQVPWDKLSDESKQKVKETYDQLADEEKKKLNDKAEGELSQVEKTVNEKIQGKSDRKGVSRPSPKKPPSGSSQPPQPTGGEQGDQEGEQQDDAANEDAQGDQSSGEGAQGESGEGSDSGAASDTGGEEEGTQTETESTDPGKGEDEVDTSEQADEQKQHDQLEDSSDPDEFNRAEHTPEEGTEQQSQKKQQELIPTTQEDMDAVDRHYDGLKIERPAPATHFDGYLQLGEIKTAVEQLMDELDPMFKPKQKKKKKYSESHGELDIDRVIDRVVGNTDSREVMFIEEKPQERSYRFTIMLDLSGSMSDKIGEAFKMIVVLSEVLVQLGIEFEVQGFTDFGHNQPIAVFKSYEETEGYGEVLSLEQKNNISQMLRAGGGSTPTSQAMLTSFNRLRQRNQETASQGKKRDVFIVITDGQPTDTIPNVPLSPEELLPAVIDQVLADAQSEGMNMALLGFGIGKGTEFVNKVFKELPIELKHNMAAKLNQHYGSKKSKGPRRFQAKDIGNSFIETSELAVLLPTIFEYVLTHPEEFSG